MSASITAHQDSNQALQITQIRGLLFGETEKELQKQISELSNDLQRETQQLQHEWQTRLQSLETRLSVLSEELHAADHQTTQTLSYRANVAEQRLQQLETHLETHLLDLQEQLQGKVSSDTSNNTPKTPLGLAHAENQRIQIELRSDIKRLHQEMTTAVQRLEAEHAAALAQVKNQLKMFFQDLIRRQNQQYAELKTEMTKELRQLQEEKVNRDDLAQLFGRMVSRLSGEMALPNIPKNQD